MSASDSAVGSTSTHREPELHEHKPRGLSSAAEDTRMPEKESPTSPTSPLAPYPPILPTESRSRAPEFYGFVAWTSTYLLFVLYLLWALLPDEYILAAGVAWYPSREWALLVPAYGMVLVLLTYVAYFALALAGTPSFSDMHTITDSKTHLPADAAAVYRAHARPDAIPELYDIPLGLVNRVVYGGPPRPRPRTPPIPEPAPAPAPGQGEPSHEPESSSTRMHAQGPAQIARGDNARLREAWPSGR